MSKATVISAIGNMTGKDPKRYPQDIRSPRDTNSDQAHEYAHAGADTGLYGNETLGLKASFATQDIPGKLHEAVARFQDIKFGSKKVVTESLAYMKREHGGMYKKVLEQAGRVYKRLNAEAKKAIWAEAEQARAKLDAKTSMKTETGQKRKGIETKEGTSSIKAQ